MDPPPPTTTISGDPPHNHHSLPPLPTPKIRLMCSYNGHITPRPQTKSLSYTGGETRIVAVDRRSTASTVSSLTHHLSRTLYNNRPFVLKYQLPNEDLDALISITTDEDLHNMLDEHDRLVSLRSSSRIRLFLFPTRPESVESGEPVGSLLLDPKSESWFSDALKGTMVVNRGLSGESLMSSGDDSGCVAESVVLESCSSFGSVNSSLSGSNLTQVGVGNEVKVAAASSIEIDESARMYQDQVIPESESIIYNPSSTVQMQRNIQVSGYPIPHIPDQRQPPVQYIQTAAPHYIQYPTGQRQPLPISSYYPMYVPYQQQPNQTYPIYYNVSAPNHIANSHVVYKEVMVSQPPAERAVVMPQPISSNRVSACSVQSLGPSDTYPHEYDNDLAYAQIYKSQPSVSVFPPQKFETVKKTEPLSDSLTRQ